MLRKGAAEVVEAWHEVRAEHGENVTAAKVRQVAIRRLHMRGEGEAVEPPDASNRARQLARHQSEIWFEQLDIALGNLDRVLAREHEQHFLQLAPPAARKRLRAVEKALVGLYGLVDPLEYRSESSGRFPKPPIVGQTRRRLAEVIELRPSR